MTLLQVFALRFENIDNKKQHIKMKKTMITLLAAGLMFAGCGKQGDKDNPLLQKWDTPFETAPFEKIKPEHYLPAFEAAIAEHEKEIEQIVSNKEAATFDNTIAALDYSGQSLSRIQGIYFNMMAANTSKELQDLQEKIGPMLAQHSDNVSMNADLFKRVKAVWDARESQKYTEEQSALLEKTYKSFVRNGALLDEAKQKELRQVNGELTTTEAKFDANLLKETKSYQLVIEKKEDLKGLPQGEIDKAAATAKELGKEGKWVFTLDNPSFIPFVTYAANRELRKEIFNARVNRCNNGGETDNNALVAKMAELRGKPIFWDMKPLPIISWKREWQRNPKMCSNFWKTCCPILCLLQSKKPQSSKNFSTRTKKVQLSKHGICITMPKRCVSKNITSMQRQQDLTLRLTM